MTSKTCNYCNEVKPKESFPKAGLRCKKCLAAWLRDYRRAQREAYLTLHPPQPKAIVTHKVCTMCGEDKPIEGFNFASKKRGVRSTYCKPCQGKRSYADALRRNNPDEKLGYRCRKFGVTVEWYREKEQQQDGKCALCGQPETHPVTKGGKIRRLAIDHNHETGQARGLLCFRCNTALDQLEKHGLEWAATAVAYLKKNE